MTQDHPIDLRHPRTHRTGRNDVGTSPTSPRPLSMVYGGGGMFGIGYCVGVAHGLAAAGVPVESAPAPADRPQHEAPRVDADADAHRRQPVARARLVDRLELTERDKGA